MELRVMLVVTLLHVNDLGRTIKVSCTAPKDLNFPRFPVSSIAFSFPFSSPVIMIAVLTTWRSQQFYEYTKLCHTTVPLLTLFPALPPTLASSPG